MLNPGDLIEISGANERSNGLLFVYDSLLFESSNRLWTPRGVSEHDTFTCFVLATTALSLLSLPSDKHVFRSWMSELDIVNNLASLVYVVSVSRKSDYLHEGTTAHVPPHLDVFQRFTSAPFALFVPGHNRSPLLVQVIR